MFDPAKLDLDLDNTEEENKENIEKKTEQIQNTDDILENLNVLEEKIVFDINITSVICKFKYSTKKSS